MELKQYIECVKKLEIEKYTLTKTIQAIDERINSLAIPRKIYKAENRPAKDHPLGGGCGAMLGTWGIIWTIIGFTFLGEIGDSSDGLAISLGTLLIGISAFIYMIYQHIKHTKIVEQVDNQISQKYAQDIKYEKYRVEQETAQKSKLTYARQTLYSTYQKTCNTLQSLYDKGIIFPKYRNNLVAICMFSEYLQSGICSVLEGHEGVYNKFESDRLMGLILVKLDEISSKLDDIANNQYMLYSALNQINNQQNRIIGNLNQMISNQEAQQSQLEYIEYNTRVLRQNSEIELMLRDW